MPRGVKGSGRGPNKTLERRIEETHILLEKLRSQMSAAQTQLDNLLKEQASHQSDKILTLMQQYELSVDDIMELIKAKQEENITAG
jgi:response regulator of citrate/malate metabolism